MRIHVAAALGVFVATLTMIADPVQASGTSWTFTSGPVVLNAASINVPATDRTGTPDGSAIRLPDGRIRMYFSMMKGREFSAIGSAISSDGRRFTVERGARVSPVKRGNFTAGASSPFIYRLPNGKYRLYFGSEGGLVSATSSNGLTFTKDPGMRLTQSAFTSAKTRSAFFCSAIVPLPRGRYRMYCTAGVRQHTVGAGTLVDRAIFSATSSNLHDWRPESGVRIGPGSRIASDADHPTLLASSRDGTVTLVYDRRPGDRSEWAQSGEFMATSADGLTFRTEEFTGIQGSEPTYVPLTTSTGWLYYGNHTPESGSTISVGSATLS